MLRQAQSNTPDFILLDVMLPGMSGFDICKRLKEDAATREIPIIFLTARSMPAEIKEAMAMGALGFYHVQRESQSASATTPPEYPARSPYANAIAASGVVEARTENIAIGAALPGLVLEVHVPSERVGTHVSAGQTLFRVDDRHLLRRGWERHNGGRRQVHVCAPQDERRVAVHQRHVEL